MSERTRTMPKMTLLLWLVGLFCLVECTGCFRVTGQDVVAQYNQNPLTVSIPSDLSPKQTEEAMVRTFIGRDWQVEQRSPQEVVGTLNHRSYDAKVILTVDNDVIKLLSESSYNAKPAVPEKWLRNLQKDLNKHLSRATFDN